jgi:serine protease Do
MPRKWTTLPALAFLLSSPLAAPAFADQAPQAPEVHPTALGAEEVREGLRKMISVARDRVFPSLVHIEVISVRFEDGREIRMKRQGSGILISPEGHVLTNEHVVQQGAQFRCTLTNRQRVSAKMVGEDPLTDLALLKINLAELPESGRNLPVAQFGDSDRLEIGDYVMAMGSPYSLSRSVTLGIVSNTARVLSPELTGSQDEMELESGQSTGLFTLWIQHDALINPGNSGGPLVDLTGNIVGINEMGGAAIGFAIPSTLARRVASELIRRGEVTRSWIGASFHPTADTNVTTGTGVLVDSVAADSPAAQAGMQAGDVLLSLNGKPISIKFPEELPRLENLIADAPVGTTLAITYSRKEKISETRVVTQKLLRDLGDEASFQAWGFTVRQISSKKAHELGSTTTGGVLVTGVKSGSPAYLAQPPLAPGDLLQAVVDTRIQNLKTLSDQYQKTQGTHSQDGILVTFDRRGKSYLTVLKPPGPVDVKVPQEIFKPWLGIATQPIMGELSEAMGAFDARGYRITRVYPTTAASKAGLQLGDIILSIDGERLIPRDLEDAGLLDQRIRSQDPGQKVRLSILRDGKVEERTVGLDRNLVTPPEAHQELNSDLGVTAREVTFFDNDENRWAADVHGVIVERIDPTGSAALAGLHSSDLIQKIDSYEVRDLQSFRDALAHSEMERLQRLPVIVLRGARTHLLYLDTTWGLGDKNPKE